MSSVNYDLKSKNVRLLTSQQAWVVGKNGKRKNYQLLAGSSVGYNSYYTPLKEAATVELS